MNRGTVAGCCFVTCMCRPCAVSKTAEHVAHSKTCAGSLSGTGSCSMAAILSLKHWRTCSDVVMSGALRALAESFLRRFLKRLRTC